MLLEELTFAAFAACNSARVVAYLPQIDKAASDRKVDTAISSLTWSLFLFANASTVAYALINRADLWMAVCFAVNAMCCLVILATAFVKRRAFRDHN